MEKQFRPLSFYKFSSFLWLSCEWVRPIWTHSTIFAWGVVFLVRFFLWSF